MNISPYMHDAWRIDNKNISFFLLIRWVAAAGGSKKTCKFSIELSPSFQQFKNSIISTISSIHSKSIPYCEHRCVAHPGWYCIFIRICRWVQTHQNRPPQRPTTAKIEYQYKQQQPLQQASQEDASENRTLQFYCMRMHSCHYWSAHNTHLFHFNDSTRCASLQHIFHYYYKLTWYIYM